MRPITYCIYANDMGYLYTGFCMHSTEAQLCRLQNTINSFNPIRPLGLTLGNTLIYFIDFANDVVEVIRQHDYFFPSKQIISYYKGSY